MKFTVIVLASPHTNGSALARQFCRAAVKRGHKIWRVFFYLDGVGHIAEVLPEWQQLQVETGLEMLACSTIADECGHTGPGNGIELAGLGQLIEAVLECERTVTFR